MPTMSPLTTLVLFCLTLAAIVGLPTMIRVAWALARGQSLRKVATELEDPAARDKRLITEAATLLDQTYDHAAGKCAPAAIQRATEILRRHSLPKHAINALVRERDRERMDRATQAKLEQDAEDAAMDLWKAEKKRPYAPPTISTLEQTSALANRKLQEGDRVWSDGKEVHDPTEKQQVIDRIVENMPKAGQA
jgi:hypothetical protein